MLPNIRIFENLLEDREYKIDELQRELSELRVMNKVLLKIANNYITTLSESETKDQFRKILGFNP